MHGLRSLRESILQPGHVARGGWGKGSAIRCAGDGATRSYTLKIPRSGDGVYRRVRVNCSCDGCCEKIHETFFWKVNSTFTYEGKSFIPMQSCVVVLEGETYMDIGNLESVVLWKLCPTCSLGMVRETKDKVFTCNHSHCGAVFDFSALSETTIAMLLQKNDRHSRDSGTT